MNETGQLFRNEPFGGGAVGRESADVDKQPVVCRDVLGVVRPRIERLSGVSELGGGFLQALLKIRRAGVVEQRVQVEQGLASLVAIAPARKEQADAARGSLGLHFQIIKRGDERLDVVAERTNRFVCDVVKRKRSQQLSLFRWATV